MSKESFYFPHDFEPTSDPKMQALIGEYGAVGYGIFWRIVEMLHSDENHKLPMKQYIFIAIAKQMLTDVEQIKNVVKYCIEVCELLVESDGFMYSHRVNRNFDKRAEISEKRSIAGKLGAIAKQNLANASKVKESKVKESKVKEIKEENKRPPLDVLSLMIRTFGRNPTFPEQELIQHDFLEKFGYETTYKLFKEASLKGFKKLITLRDNIEIINNKPQIKERENERNNQRPNGRTQDNLGRDDPGERELLERLKNRPYASTNPKPSEKI